MSPSSVFNLSGNAGKAPMSSISNRTGGRHIKSFVLNFGPQHPAAHGILKLIAQMNGEVIDRVDPQFGLLHRGTEKLFEARPFLQALPYFDRFDYVANLFQEHAYCHALEKLNGLQNKPLDGALLAYRTLFDEMSRIMNHLLTLSATSLDLGVMGPLFWAFEERERLMELFERVSGARMHTALYRPFTVDLTPLTAGFFRDLAHFLTRCGRSLSGAFLGLLHNRVIKTRLAMLGQISKNKALAHGISGVIARSTGLCVDLRLTATPGYGAYRGLTFRTFLGRRGDNLDRFLLRIKEMVESFRIISQVAQMLNPITEKGVAAFNFNRAKGLPALMDQPQVQNTAASASNPRSLFLVPSKGPYSSMEALIHHFRLSSEGHPSLPGLAYGGVEGPKGEVGVTILSGGGVRPYRLKVRTPVSHNMHLIPLVARGVLFADFVATFCSLDIVLGEIDR
jgi:NADH-quinone oxidoreductase subunit D